MSFRVRMSFPTEEDAFVRSNGIYFKCILMAMHLSVNGSLKERTALTLRLYTGSKKSYWFFYQVKGGRKIWKNSGILLKDCILCSNSFFSDLL